ncbi:alpha/beta fold hydrolase [Deinococcus pimensis]|uniref:alpha/beta fold hydrolase n=1 Tax=Deinococcus pimensis TaxID=309888 RepID=UPI0004B2AEED|nr:alpha/beta hydrolase [Deinococcus pimensis]
MNTAEPHVESPGIPYRHSLVPTNGVTLHVVEAGPVDGPPVVLLHGFPEFWYGWRHQIDELARAGYRVLAPDQRGYGLSGKPPGVHAYAVRELVRDVVGLLDWRGIPQAFVVGHDWGAAVAWALAITHPERVRRLAILNVPHPAVFARTLRESADQRRRSWYMFLFQLPALPEALLRAGNFRLAAASLQATSRPGTFTEEDLARYREAWGGPGALTGMLNWYRAAFRVPRVDGGGDLRVRVPTLIVWGAEDRFLKREMAEESAAQVEGGARLRVLEGVSHWVQHEAAAEVNAELLDFLR